MKPYIMLFGLLVTTYVSEGSQKVALDDFRRSLREFSGSLLYYISATQPSQNVFFSPTSISHLIGTVLAGANGTTEVQIMRTLNINPSMNYSEKNINKLFKKVYRKLFNVTKRYDSARMESGLFLQTGYPVHPEYTETIKEYYETEVKNINFQLPQIAVQKINNWVSERTEGLIRELLTEDSIEPLTRMILVNALYFQSSWAIKMKKVEDEKMEFKTPTGKKETPFMKGNLAIKMNLVATTNMYEIAIPYENQQAYFVIIMPRTESVMTSFYQRMSLTNYFRDFKKRFDSWRDIKIPVLMPMFEMEESLDMVDILKVMGIRDLFDEGRSNLTGIAEEPLHVSSFIHKAKLTVDEKGTVAAAASGATLSGRSSGKRQIVIDSPFVFGIYRHDSLLFLGRMVDPSPPK